MEATFVNLVNAVLTDPPKSANVPPIVSPRNGKVHQNGRHFCESGERSPANKCGQLAPDLAHAKVVEIVEIVEIVEFSGALINIFNAYHLHYRSSSSWTIIVITVINHRHPYHHL